MYLVKFLHCGHVVKLNPPPPKKSLNIIHTNVLELLYHMKMLLPNHTFPPVLLVNPD